MKKLFRLPFRRQLAIVLILLSLLIAIFTSIFSYQLAYRQFRDMSVQLTQNSISTVRASVDDYFSTIQQCTTDILSSSSLRTLATLSQSETENRAQALWSIALADVRSGIAAASGQRVHFSHIEFYLQNGCSYSTDRQLQYADYSACLNALSEGGLNVADAYVGTHDHIAPHPLHDGSADHRLSTGGSGGTECHGVQG